MKSKELLFSLTSKDFDFETFRSSGPGGQNKNKVNSAVRCRHRETGLFAEAKESRDQKTNKINAFARLCAKKEFQAWLKLNALKVSGVLKQIEEEVEETTKDKYLKVEVQKEGKWVEFDPQN